MKYRSSYEGRLHEYADALARARQEDADAWCIFDNTASSAAIVDALEMREMVLPEVAP